MLLLLFIAGCGPKIHFIKVGRDIYPSKPGDVDIIVYLKDKLPEKEYRIIGMVHLESESSSSSQKITKSEIVRLFKKEARRRGADAIIDFKIASGYTGLSNPYIYTDRRKIRRAEAKLIIFIKNDSKDKS